ncbi:MAG: DUF1540 domain-containing protein [Oscillospiraceae bacterium]|jgi:hypothetical protein|nr:DUF1540 domain-containing protein [Oscillospiraceae bacterium]
MDIFNKDKNEEITPIVYCDVKNCVYHSGENICKANKINVGPTHALSSYDTICSTFKPEKTP